MTLATMIYGLIVAVLVAGAAWFLDRGLRALGRPTRWVWIGALGVGGLAPFFPRLLPAAATADGPGPFALPVRSLYELGAPAPPLAEYGGSLQAGTGLEDALAALWILGSVLVLIFFALLCLRLRRLRARWEPREVCGEEVLRSERFGPAVVGLIRSWIVLPSWTFGLGERELEMVVLHEREHVRARDPALLATGLLLASLSPWNPAVWWLMARLRLAVEGDCDRRVLARATPARGYARLLLTVAAGCRRTPDPAPALIRGGHSTIERRLIMIRTATRKPRIRASIMAAAAGLGLVALACDTPVPQSPGEPERASRLEGSTSEDGTLQALDAPEAEAHIRRLGERRKREVESVRERLKLEQRLRTGEIAKEKIPEDLWLRLGTAAERLDKLSGKLESGAGLETTSTELAMEVRRLWTAIEAGEITRDEATQRLRTLEEARALRLRFPDRPR